MRLAAIAVRLAEGTAVVLAVSHLFGEGTSRPTPPGVDAVTPEAPPILEEPSPPAKAAEEPVRMARPRPAESHAAPRRRASMEPRTGAGTPRLPAEAEELGEEPLAEPLAEPVPAEAGRPTATVVLKGDARRLWLTGPGGDFAAGQVPPGSYTVRVFFGDAEPVEVGRISLAAGDEKVIACSSALLTCRY